MLVFRTYADYRKSQLWKSIRAKVVKERCEICGSPSSDVHHFQYDDATLLGRDLSHLFTVCRQCHDMLHADAEFLLSNEFQSHLDLWTVALDLRQAWLYQGLRIYDDQHMDLEEKWRTWHEEYRCWLETQSDDDVLSVEWARYCTWADTAYYVRNNISNYSRSQRRLGRLWVDALEFSKDAVNENFGKYGDLPMKTWIAEMAAAVT